MVLLAVRAATSTPRAPGRPENRWPRDNVPVSCGSVVVVPLFAFFSSVTSREVKRVARVLLAVRALQHAESVRAPRTQMATGQCPCFMWPGGCRASFRLLFFGDFRRSNVLPGTPGRSGGASSPRAPQTTEHRWPWDNVPVSCGPVVVVPLFAFFSSVTSPEVKRVARYAWPFWQCQLTKSIANPRARGHGTMSLFHVARWLSCLFSPSFLR
jgi:hypothetical protein